MMQQDLGKFDDELKVDITKGSHSGGAYSHSRLSSFEQCRLKFKFSYIDKVKTEIQGTIESFMGSLVHDVLEKLYKDLRYQKLNSLKELLDFYEEEWRRKWDDSYLIVRKEYTPENYLGIGRKAITDYYERFKPFDSDRTIATEQRIMIRIRDGREYLIQGYIDRLSYDGDGIYSIHDYKTSNTLMTQEYADKDRQLALYAIAVKQNYPDAVKVRLIWHYLVFDKDVVSWRTDEQLEDLKKETIDLIQQIESTREFPPTTSALCDWCEFQPLCPNFRHRYELLGKAQNEYMADDGVKLVEKYAELSLAKNKAEAELEKVKEALFAFAKKKDLGVVQGKHHIATLKSYPRLSFPKKGDPLQQDFFSALKKIGLWDSISTADVYELTKKINCGDIHPELVAVLEPFIERGKNDRIYLRSR